MATQRRTAVGITMAATVTFLAPALLATPTANAGTMDRYCTPTGSKQIARVSIEFTQTRPDTTEWYPLKITRRSWAIAGPHRAVKLDAPPVGTILPTGSKLPVTIKWKRKKGGPTQQCSVSIRVFTSDLLRG